MDTLKIKNLNELESIAKQFLRYLKQYKIIAFSGTLGAGKTTFIKAICSQLNVTSNVASPSFAIINEYITENKDIIYHMDFYRIRDEEEVFDMGYEDYFYNGNHCFIEWPEKISRLLPRDTLYVNITQEDNDCRIIEVNDHMDES